MSKKFLSTTHAFEKCFKSKRKPISKKTRAKMRQASQLAQAKIDFDNTVYQTSAKNASSYYVL